MNTFAQKPKATQRPVSARSTSLHLQRAIAFQAGQGLVQARSDIFEAVPEPTASAHFGHDFSRLSVHVRSPEKGESKLLINTPGDIYEQEADRISEQVMRAPEPQRQHTSGYNGGCPTNQERQPNHEHDGLHTKRVPVSDKAQIAAPSVIHEVLAAPGQPLDTATRGFMESHFGHDFSRVRVHTDQLAVKSAEAVAAQAYTVGSDVVFGSGCYASASRFGHRLLAHELTHVVQQGAAPPFVSSNSDRGLTIGKKSNATVNITPAAPGIQRRNGGFRPPSRPARGRVPSRGREGQREGQRLPRETPTRREAARREEFARRERERIEAARKRFDEMVKRNQRWLENWAKEGSEPKTPGQRAMRVLGKILEAWDELSSSWDKTHSALEESSRRRLDLEDTTHSIGTGVPSWITVVDQQLIGASRDLSHFDAEMLRRLTEWQERMDKWEAWRDRVYLTVTNVINLSIDLTELLLDAHLIASELRKQLGEVDRDVQAILNLLRMRPRLQTGPPQTSAREAD